MTSSPSNISSYNNRGRYINKLISKASDVVIIFSVFMVIEFNLKMCYGLLRSDLDRNRDWNQDWDFFLFSPCLDCA